MHSAACNKMDWGERACYFLLMLWPTPLYFAWRCSGTQSASFPARCPVHALRQVKPGQSWFDGCITGVGDSCHATTPFLAQGGSMALEVRLYQPCIPRH